MNNFELIEHDFLQKLKSNKLPSDLDCKISNNGINYLIDFFWERKGNSIYYLQAKSFRGLSQNLVVCYENEIIPFLKELSNY